MPRFFTGPWMWEISALIGVFVSFAVLVTLLAVFDGRPIFEWKSVTLNTIVSTLSIFIRGLLLYSISECIGQWKWIMFEKSERYLIDFERVDAASRGPLGSLTLTWQRNIPWILRIGGFVTLLTLAVDPFSQQLVQLDHDLRYETFRGYSDQSSTPSARSYNRGHVLEINQTESSDGDQKVSIIGAQPNITMEAAILNGISQPQEVLDSGFQAVCPTGNCTWKPFETLGVCKRCENVTSELQRVRKMDSVLKVLHGSGDDDDGTEFNATALALPNGHFLMNPDGCYTAGSTMKNDCEISQPNNNSLRIPGYSMTSYGTGDPKKTNTMQNLTTMIWAMSVIHLDEAARTSRRLQEIKNDLYGLEETMERLDPYEHPMNDPEASLNIWPDSPVLATECALYYCVTEIDMSISHNQLQYWMEEVQAASLKPGSWEVVNSGDLAQENMPNNTGSLEFHEMYSAANMSDIVFHFPSRDSDEEFTVAQEAVKSIGAYFQNTFRASLWADESEALKLVKERIPDAAVLINGQIKTGSSENPPSIRGIWSGMYSEVPLRFQSLADSMTNEMRSEGETPTVPTVTGGGHHVFGMTGIDTTVYRSGFYWIFLHAAVMILGVLFCLFTMWTSTRGPMKDRPVWKNHSLATMRQGAMWSKGFVQSSDSLQLLEKVARKEKVVITSDRKISAADGE